MSCIQYICNFALHSLLINNFLLILLTYMRMYDNIVIYNIGLRGFIILPNQCPEKNLSMSSRTLDERKLKDSFLELVSEWRQGTGGLSSPRAITIHPAYQQIIKMGEEILPLIFEELQKNDGWWYPALRILTGENPVPKEAKGRPQLNKEAWLEWGRKNGYLQS